MVRPPASRHHIASSVLVVALALSLLPASWVSPASAADPPTPTPAGTVPEPFISGHAELYGWGMATLEDGTIAIGDYWNRRVQHYAPDGTLIDRTLIANAGSGAQQHQSPYGLGVDPANGDLYMADTDRKTIDRYRYDPATGQATFVTTWGRQGDGLGRYQYPSRVEVDSAGRVYIADTWANNIEITTRTGSPLKEFGSFGAGQGQFKQPHGMRFDYNGAGVQDDELFVVNTNNKRIEVFGYDPNTGYVDRYRRSFGCAKSSGQPGCVFVGDLRGLAIDQVNDWVYIVDAAGNRVHKYATNGTLLLTFGATASDANAPGDGEFSDGGREVTVGPDGRVWVGDMPNFRAQVFGSNGVFRFEVPSTPAPPPEGGFNGPRGVAVGADGSMFVTDTYNQRVQRLGPGGAFVTAWGSRGRDEYAFNYPRMLATDPNDGSVVVADTDNHRIKKYSPNGVFRWGLGSRGTTLGTFRNPHGVDVGPDGRIYVADTRNCRVQILSASGSALSAFGSCGDANGQFRFPRGIALDTNGTAGTADDTIWVADSQRDVVQHFSLGGAFLGKFGSSGTGGNQLAGPFDVEADGEYVYVADAQRHQIKIWTDPGPGAGTPVFVMAYGSRGTGPGRFIQPQGLDLSADGRTLYVAEQGNERIQRITLSGPTGGGGGGDLTHVRTIGGPGHAEMYPSGLEIDASDGATVVADTGNDRVKKYDASGSLLWDVGGFGTSSNPPRFNAPRDVGIDAAGDVFVADTGNVRIVKLDGGTGAFVRAWKGVNANKIESPIGITVSLYDDLVYVADAGAKQVRVYDTDGGLIRSFGQDGACEFSALRDVDAGPNGSVYIANYLKNDILKMSPTGTCRARWGTKGTATGQFKNPYGVRVVNDPAVGTAVFVADSNNNRVQEFTPDGAFVATLGSAGTAANRFGGLRRVAVGPARPCPAGQCVTVAGADLWGWKIGMWTGNGSQGYAFDTELPSRIVPPPGDGGTTLADPPTSVFNVVRAVAFAPNGTLRVIDSVNQRVVRLRSDGALTAGPWDTCGERGWKAGAFNWPRGIAIDPATGDMWVADTKQSRLQVIPADCSGATIIGTRGSGPTNLNWPYAVAIRASDRTAFVADTKNHRIVAYDVATGAPIASYGSMGSGAGRFTQPAAISVDPASGRLFVADRNNHRIVELSFGGSSFSWVGTYAASGGLQRPEGVAADGERIYVADTANDRLVVIGRDDGVVDDTVDGMHTPQSVAVDANGCVYLSDSYHDVIEVYTYGGCA